MELNTSKLENKIIEPETIDQSKGIGYIYIIKMELALERMQI